MTPIASAIIAIVFVSNLANPAQNREDGSAEGGAVFFGLLLVSAAAGSIAKVVVTVRELGGNSVPAVFGTESQASAFIRARVAKGTVLHADEAGS